MQVDASTLNGEAADQAINGASEAFSQAADTWWETIDTTYEIAGSGQRRILLPFKPINSITQVRIDGAIITDWKLIRRTLYRSIGFGFGFWGQIAPSLIEVDLNYGFNSVPGDVKAAVLDSALPTYLHIDPTVTFDRVGPFQVHYAQRLHGGLTDAAYTLALSYAGVLVK